MRFSRRRSQLYRFLPDEKDRFFEEIEALWEPSVPTTFTNDDEKAPKRCTIFTNRVGGTSSDCSVPTLPSPGGVSWRAARIAESSGRT